jgi:hypothetical protein
MYLSVSETQNTEHQKKLREFCLSLAVLKPPGTVLKPYKNGISS